MFFNSKIVPKLEGAGVDQVEKNLAAGLYSAHKVPTVQEWLKQQKTKKPKAATPPPETKAEAKAPPVKPAAEKPAAKKPAAKTATAGSKKKSRFRSKK